MICIRVSKFAANKNIFTEYMNNIAQKNRKKRYVENSDILLKKMGYLPKNFSSWIPLLKKK